MGGGVSQMEVVNEVNDMVATIFTNIALFCSTVDTASQTISIECTPPVTDPNSIYELNSSCISCFSGVRDTRLQYYSFQEQAWKNGEQVPGVKMPIDQDFQDVIQQFISCTKNHCKACVAENLSQKTIIQSVLSCQAFNQVKNSINQQLMNSITQKLTNNQDMLAPLAGALGAKTTNDLVYNLTNRISVKITNNVISNIQQQISSQQSININNGGGTLNQKGVNQQSAFHSIQTYLQRTNIFNNILSSQQWSLMQKLANEQNTVGSLGNTVVKSVAYLSKLLSNVVGKVVLFVLVMVGVIAVGILMYIVSNLIRKELKKQHDKDIQKQALAEHLPVFETF